MNNIFNPTRKLAQWLEDRDWFVKRDIDWAIESYEQDIEKARIDATAKLLGKLDELRESAKYEMGTGEKAKHRQAAKTEYNKIKKEMKRLENTIPYGKSPLSTEWELTS